MADVCEVGLATMPDPEATDQAPVPKAAALPASVEPAVQTVWSGPAFAVVGT